MTQQEKKELINNAETICNQLVEQLKQTREKKGLTTYKLAELTWLRQPNITRMETFQTIPNLTTIVGVAEALDLELVLRKKKKPVEETEE